ncbi:uncharacterized protein TNIN_207511 [Trichonephila inaurata madagascariensis]|uniref:Uncharacterized protein n=1 Tax=Trichonephila inaurata madagascariensis TaxID=2747483 RepID=A0A8X6XF14_9ARAC|nr:uncharacterized protein TNIN_207511 [Trichonephila inaurata madagascariensis]
MQLPKIFLSLQQMCLSKIAFSLFNDPDIRHFTRTHGIHSCIWSSEEIEAFLGNEPYTSFDYAWVYEITSNASPSVTRKYKHYFTGDGKDPSLPNKQWKLLVGQKISTLPLPNIMKKKVTALVRLLFMESNKWLHDHARVMDISMNSMMDSANLQSHFHWTQDNKIDRQKTLKGIVADNNIDIKDRFMLASHYCFQDGMSSLWGQLKIWQQHSYIAELSVEMSSFWTPWLKDACELDWEEYIRVFPYNAFGLRTYLPKLRQEKRLQCLMHLLSQNRIDYHELQFCLSLLDQNQQNEIFKKCPLEILWLFLDWPAHEKLLDVVEVLRPNLTGVEFLKFFVLIPCLKHMLNWTTYDYVTFVKKLWKKVPFESRQFIERDPMYNILKSVLEYDGSNPPPRGLHKYDTLKACPSGNTVFVISKCKRNLSKTIFSLSNVFHLYRRINLMCFVRKRSIISFVNRNVNNKNFELNCISNINKNVYFCVIRNS